MNKLFIFAIVALVAVASAELDEPEHYEEEMTELAAFGDDETETRKLTGDNAIFRDFCLESRDDVKAYLSGAANKKASAVFKFIAEIFADTANKVGVESGKAVEEGDALINEDARNAPSAFAKIGQVFLRTAKGEFAGRIAEIKEEINGENVVGAIQGACQSVSMDLKPMIENKLAAAKKDLNKSGNSAQYAALIKSVKLNNVGCMTTGRLSLVSRGCELMTALLPTLSSYLQ